MPALNLPRASDNAQATLLSTASNRKAVKQ
jgi:hypothetical protein